MAMNFSGRSGLFFGVVASAFLMLAGCAATGPAPAEAAEATVKARAEQRWEALVKSDLKAAYDLMSPGSRSAVTSEQYAATLRPGFWKAATVDKVACDTPDRCEVMLTIEYDYRGARFKTPVRDIWIKESGNWWYLRQ